MKKKTIEVLKNTPEDSLIMYHHGLGTWIRNNLGLWEYADLTRYFTGIGIFHPDDMSGIIIVSYHRYLNHENIELKKQILKYQEFYKDINYLPPVDSTLVEERGNVSFGFGTGYGYYGKLKNLNNTLKTSPYPTINTTYIPILFSVSLHKKGFSFNTDFIFNQDMETDTSNNFQSELTSTFLQFDLAYDVYQTNKFALLLFAGYGIGSLNLQLQAPASDSASWQNISNTLNRTDIVKGPIATVNWGIGVRSNSNKRFHWDGKIGYLMSINDSEWNVNRINLGKEPNDNIGELYFKITAYLNINKLMIR